MWQWGIGSWSLKFRRERSRLEINILGGVSVEMALRVMKLGEIILALADETGRLIKFEFR